METVKSPIWDGTKMSLVPQFSWGGRVANGPPNFPFPGWLNTNQTTDMTISLTKVKSSHTLKAGFYWNHSFKAQQSLAGTWQGSINFGNDANNLLDTQFGFANAAMGVFSSYSQLSKYVEGNYVYNNIEGFIQDNWRVNSRLTLDYGVRLVHQQPQYDALGQGVNLLPDKWSLSSAPLYYLAGCATTAPCSGSNRQAKDPRTGQLLGPNTAVAIGTLVPGSGNFINGLVPSGTDPVPTTTYNWPTLRPAPRFGVAYDVTGKQRIIFRGGAGHVLRSSLRQHHLQPDRKPAQRTEPDIVLLPVPDDGWAHHPRRCQPQCLPAQQRAPHHLDLERRRAVFAAF